MISSSRVCYFSLTHTHVILSSFSFSFYSSTFYLIPLFRNGSHPLAVCFSACSCRFSAAFPRLIFLRTFVCIPPPLLPRTGLINEGLLKQMIHLVESPVAAKVIIEVAAVLNNMSTAFESHREMASTPMLHALFALLQVSHNCVIACDDMNRLSESLL